MPAMNLKLDNSACKNRGFTLTELAIVLVIVALLIGGMLVPLSAQRDLLNIKETQRLLAEIREALLGFAVINGRLPCPTTTTDPANANYGVEDAACASVEGYLPWKSLGVPEIDAWGSKRTANGQPFSGYWRYRVDNAFSVAFTLNTTPTSGLSIKDASGNSLTQTAPNNPVAIVYSTGPNLVGDGLNAVADATFQAGDPSPGFDDMLVWIGRPILLSRMVSAGRLP